MAEPQSYEPEKLTSGVTWWTWRKPRRRKTTFAAWRQDCARSGTTTLRRSSGGENKPCFLQNANDFFSL